MSRLSIRFKIKHITTSVARPNANHSERLNQNLKYMLKVYFREQNLWDINYHFYAWLWTRLLTNQLKWLPPLLYWELNHPLKFCYNINDDLKPDLNCEQRIQMISQHLKETHQRTNIRYNANRIISKFQVGDEVLYCNVIQVIREQSWKELYIVVKIASPNLTSRTVVHISQIKMYHSNTM